jgi:hypothetical protein
MEYPALCETFNCLYYRTIALHSKMRAAFNTFSINIDSARTTLTGLTTNMGPCQVHLLSQKMNQKSPGIHQLLSFLTI